MAFTDDFVMPHSRAISRALRLSLSSFIPEPFELRFPLVYLSSCYLSFKMSLPSILIRSRKEIAGRFRCIIR